MNGAPYGRKATQIGTLLRLNRKFTHDKIDIVKIVCRRNAVLRSFSLTPNGLRFFMQVRRQSQVYTAPMKSAARIDRAVLFLPDIGRRLKTISTSGTSNGPASFYKEVLTT